METCHICGKPEVLFGRIVRECDICEEPSCDDCVECDYDSVGDPPHFVCCQWDCRACLNKVVALVLYDRDFAREQRRVTFERIMKELAA